ncbi:hypothetical protein M413DRAFT_384302 [Hebeloma cylindrosporum]|uniref:Uncharacterized protein n=1 Tax=Hebeloma cylindrosporum TaxID=76867 RepID=A0A0C3CHJ1_HEBCY|nr:hypothetical protein M413DRAFT_384302 [Hebeloma cylindrosporum h7]
MRRIYTTCSVPSASLLQLLLFVSVYSGYVGRFEVVSFLVPGDGRGTKRTTAQNEQSTRAVLPAVGSGVIEEGQLNDGSMKM